MTEHPGLNTPGKAIRSAREQRGWSVADLSERTKIPPPVLEALEGDQYHKVSGALYIKSFLRTCAAELGLEEDEILALYGGTAGNEPATGPGSDMVWEDDEVQISRIGLPWRLIGLVGAALILLGLGVLGLTRGCAGGGDDPAAVVETVATPPVDGESGDDAVADPGPGTQADALPAATNEPVDASREMGNRSDGAAAADNGQDEIRTGGVPGGNRRGDASRDTLAGGWAASPPRPAADTAQQTTPQAVSRRPASDTAERRPVPVATAPLPVVGGPNLVFEGGENKPVVVRVICDGPMGIEVKPDAAPAFLAAKWPAPGASAPRLPATGIEPGRVYESSRGLVVYWGAEDHLSLRLDSTTNVEVSLNGQVRDIRNLRPGGELLLDAHGD